MNRFLSLIFFLVFWAFFDSASGQQTSTADGNFTQKAIDNAVGHYDKLMSSELHLYNGTEYVGFDRSIKGNEYFGSDDWEEGNIFYDGQLYKKVFLRYDLYDDGVLTEHFGRNGYYAKVQLIKEKVGYFDLLGHHFVHIEPDSAENSILRAGFYDVLYDGSTKVLVKRIKEIQQSDSGNTLQEEFSERNRIFVEKEGQYFSVKSKRSVIKVLKDQKKDLRRFARHGHLDFTHDREASIVKLARHYDQSNGPK